MPASCSALGCTNRLKKSSPIKFFGFPIKNETLCQAWVEASGRMDFTPNKSSKLCSEHFKEEDFLDRPCSLKTRLKPEAVPSFFPSLPVARASYKKRKLNDTVKETVYIPEGMPEPSNIEVKDKAVQTKISGFDPVLPEKRVSVKRENIDGLRDFGTQTKGLPTPENTETKKKVKVYQQKIRRKDRKIKRLENTIKSLLTKELIEILEAKQKSRQMEKMNMKDESDEDDCKSEAKGSENEENDSN